MKTFSVVPFLVSARFLAPFACITRAISLFSIAAQSSERHANEIADDRIAFSNSALVSCARSIGRPFQSLIPAEVC